MLRWRTRLSKPSHLSSVVNLALATLFCAVTLAALFRYFVLDSEDPYKCNALTNEGRWLDSTNYLSAKQRLQNWQPPGCMLHRYNSKDLATCFNSRKIVLVGDSTIRQIYWAIARKLDARAAEEGLRIAAKHVDLRFQSKTVDLIFLWDPYLNSARLHEELKSFGEGANYSEDGNKTQSASIVVLGGGLWDARYIDGPPLQHFKTSVDEALLHVRPSLRDTPRSGPRSVINAPIDRDLFALAPVQVPLYEALSQVRRETITSAEVDSMNDYLRRVSGSGGPMVLWNYLRMTWQQQAAYGEDGLHVIDTVASQQAEVLLNLRCNAKFDAQGGYPFDRTCCSRYIRPNKIQWILLFCGLWAFPVLAVIVGKDSRRLPMLPSRKILHALLVIGLAMCYCFAADRTHIFNKVQKHFESSEFKSCSWIMLMIGVLSICRIPGGAPTSKQTVREQRSDQPFLSREQTNEWKGWMQIMILIYHYTGASKVLWIYEFIRLQVAAYLFMSGFGHTVYFYTKGDYSFRRFASVLVRLNLLSCLLPYVMRTDYLFYYFAPLVTFWFIAIYLTMRVGSWRNGSLIFLLSKIAVSAAVTTALTRVPGMLELVFSVLSTLGRIEWNVLEWRFRVSLDMYAVYVGMLAGIMYVRLQNTFRGNTDYRAYIPIRNHFRTFHLISVFLSVGIIPVYWAVTRQFPDKFSYNGWQPYISPFPILAYVVLRNSNRHFRNFHSSIFAWLGRCSLETFTLQFHIWLAGDTKGLLSIGILKRTPDGGRRVDFVLLTMVFLWVSWHVAAATGTLTSWIIDPKAGRKEVEIEDRGSQVSLELPRTKSFEMLSSPMRKDTKRGVRRYIRTPLQILRDDLRARIALILGVMWVCNWMWY